MNRRFALGILILAVFRPPASLPASERTAVTTTVYDHDDYVRHPRMEEEDRLRNNVFSYAPGLEIITDIDDAEVRLSGEKAGRTPWESSNMAAGAYRVRLERTGYEVVEFRVEVRSDRRTVVVVTMDEPTGLLKLRDLPEGSAVTVDRVAREGSEIEVPAGTRSLAVSAFGWDPVQATVEIHSDSVAEWTYEGRRTPFEVNIARIRPRELPGNDDRGFLISWTASSAGSADIRVIDPSGRTVTAIPFTVTGDSGSVVWRPSERTGEAAVPGTYRIVIAGTGFDGRVSSAESELFVDDRFVRKPRPGWTDLPGLVYAPGAAMLPPGILQVSTGAGFVIGTGTSGSHDGVPVKAAFRFSPVRRWEFSGRFGMTSRDPFEDTDAEYSISASWRMNRGSGPFATNLALAWVQRGFASDFTRVPAFGGGTDLPGLSLAAPMEAAAGPWSFVLTPRLHLAFLGEDSRDWSIAAPPRFCGSLAVGAYREGRRFLTGLSASLRSPDASGTFLDWTMWTGIEGRFDLPGDASYLAAFCGIRYLDIDPVVSAGVEFGIIR